MIKLLQEKNKTVDESRLFNHRPLKDGIFEYLHTRIINGSFAPGEWLRQEEIASRLGVSMTPVREALDLLVSSGLAERVPYRGVRVLQLSPEEIADAYSLRLLLEVAAARAAAVNRKQMEADRLVQIVEEMRPLITLNDMSIQRQMNREFHLTLVRASGNVLLAKLYEMVSNKFPDWMLYEYMFHHPELLQSSLDKEYAEHKTIAEAIIIRQPDLAAQQVALHIKNRSRELVTFLGIPEKLLDSKVQQLSPLITDRDL